MIRIYELDEKYSQTPKLAMKCRLKNVYLEEKGIENLAQYKQDLLNEMSECLGSNSEDYFAIFSKVIVNI